MTVLPRTKPKSRATINTDAEIRRLLRKYTEMPGHPSFPDWRLLRDQAILALAVTEGV